MKKIYKISSPLNFRRDPNIEHGSIKYFSKLPDWAKNNPCLVVEVEEVKDVKQENLEQKNIPQKEEKTDKKVKTVIEPEKELEIKKEEDELGNNDDLKLDDKEPEDILKDQIVDDNTQSDLRCSECDFVAKSVFGLKVHQKFKHK